MENLSQAHISQVLQELWPVGVCAVALLLLLLWDVYISLKRRAHWAPGQALVLTALAIQVLDFTNDSDISYLGSKHQRNQQAVILVREDQLLFDCARLMMCVFLAYLLPAVVSSKTRSDIRALVLGILLHMVFEVYSVLKVINKPSFGMPNSRQSVWFIVSNATLFTANLLMLTLLSSAVSAGECIRRCLLGKVHWVLSCCSTSTSAFISSLEECKNSCSLEECKNWCCTENTDSCENTEDHVLKCWIVARVSQPENIRGRSVFSSLAGVIVTIAVVIVVVKWSCIQLPLHYGIAHTLTVFIEMAFILVGWMVISFRWLTAVLYFPRMPGFLQKQEQFWTQSIVELQADLDAQSKSHFYKEKILKKRKPGQRVIRDLITTVRLHSVLLPLRVWLQILMISLSKACWGLSQTLMGMIRPLIIMNTSSWRQERPEQFYKFQKTLSFIRMSGETAVDLWRANQMAFRRIQRKIEEGDRKGKESKKLIQLIQKQSPVLDKYFKLKEEDEIYFNKMSFKKRGASLMYCMVHLYEHSNNFEGINGATRDNIINTDIKSAVDMAHQMAVVIDVAMEACSEAWDLLDFLDSSDNVGADREFDTLRNMWQINFGNLENLKVSIQELADRHTENRERSGQPAGATGEREKWHGSLENWHRSLENLTLQCDSYKKLYKKFHSCKMNAQVDDKENAQVDDNEHEENIKGLDNLIMNAQVDDKEHKENIKDLENLERILASVIRDFLEKGLDKVLVEKCNNWAEQGKEEEIYNAAFIAGKAKGLTRYKSFKATENSSSSKDVQ